MPVHNWDKLERKPLNPLITGKVVQTEKAMVARITCPVGPVNMHTHDFDQITNMLRGKMRWVIEGEGEFIVGPNDVMLMKAGVAHGGEVLEEAEYLDVFVPPRQDFSWYKQNL
ncbi:MAG: AraC family ligand binding domain-containing protein [Spirochaetia bacterium]|jgi:quercetin dioxygenase-like cupin family protein|nr:AraC family ligand binding domain-containing protein [Spirochaetia bacterium]